MANKLPLIRVRGTGFNDKKLTNKVVHWERHPDHPNGEAFVSHDNRVYEVAETAEVKRKIGEGQLERVNGNSKAEGDEGEPAKNKGGRPKGNGAPPLRKATDAEERNAKPPVTGNPDEATSQVPVTP